ncbi:MAG: MoaD/ThiS family protein [Actinomycetota bacterium]
MRVRLFAAARETAGRAHDTVDPAQAATVEEACAVLRARYGPGFAAVLDASRVWVNGDEPEAGGATPLGPGDELAVLPPVSGGAGPSR